MKYEVFTLGKHFLQVHTSKGFTLFANAKLDPNGEVVSYTDKLERRGGSWVIDTWKFLTVKYFPENPIYCAVFGFADDDTEVKVNATDIDVDSISGVNGQLVDIGNISLPSGQVLPVNTDGFRNQVFSSITDSSLEDLILSGYTFYDIKGMAWFNKPQCCVNGWKKKLALTSGVTDLLMVDISWEERRKIMFTYFGNNQFTTLNVPFDEILYGSLDIVYKKGLDLVHIYA